MSDEPRIRELLEQILESQCDPEEACAECPELLPRVRKRLELMRQIENQIDALFPSSDAEGHLAPIAPYTSGKLPQIDCYEVEGVLGRGGMGIVYRARHLKLNRIVALKMLLAGPYASPQEVARFLRESRAVAELQHPHIVQVHDVGDLDGRPYFTMEFVEGGSLAEDLAGTPQLARRTAELVALLADAVHLAHTKGIIHRDLKPANILLTADRTPKIADFGLARHVDGDPMLTMSDARIGTPSYMAPEQALGKLGIVGPPVDIYALGAILYEMLTGRPPFRAETAIETERQVITVEAVPPSRLNANVPRDLETICLKCLHKDPARRYASAAELADDLRRFIGGQPVRARPVSRLERAWRWGKRNQSVVAALSGVALLLTLIVVGSVWAATHFRKLEVEHRKLAQEKGNLADQKGRLLAEKDQEREKAVLAENREARLRRQSEEQGNEFRRNLYLAEMNLAGQAKSIPSGLCRVSELLERWGSERPDLRKWEWYYLNGLCHRFLFTRTDHLAVVYDVAWNPSGTRIASAGADRAICIWDVSNERPPLRLSGHSRDVLAIAWSPDGQRLASASWDRTVRVWDTMSGAEVNQFSGHTAEVFAVAWSPTGNTIASSGEDQTIQIWAAVDGTIRNVLRGHHDTVAGLAFSPDGRRLASCARNSTIYVWDMTSGMVTQKMNGHTNWVNQVSWNPEGSRLASASNDQTLRIWDPENGQELLKISGHTQGGISHVAWSPDGTRLASSSDDQTVSIWLADTGIEAFSLRGHTAPLTSVAWNPKGDRIASAGYDRSVKVWDAYTGAETPVITGHDKPVTSITWHQKDSTLCATADSGGFIKVWDIAGRKFRWTWQADKQIVYSLAWHPAGTRLAAASANGLIRLWDVAPGTEPTVIEAHTGMIWSVAWSPDGRRLASGGSDKAIRIWDAISGTVSRVIQNHTHSVYTVAWSPDGRHLASASGDRTVKIWLVATGEEVLCYRGHTSEVLTVAWSPDGSTLASAGYDQTVHLWDVATGQRTSHLHGHMSHVAQVVWSPDGSRLASAGRDGTVKIWDTQTCKEALTPESQASQASGVAWSPDGMILISANDDHLIRIHDATAGYVAARSQQSLTVIDRELSADSSQYTYWRIRAEIHAQNQEWKQAAVDARQFLLRKSYPAWLILEGALAGPYPEDLNVRCSPEDCPLFGTAVPGTSAGESSESVNWKVVPYNSTGLVDFGSLREHIDHVSAYLRLPIYSLEDQHVAVLVGADDRARLWLNGELLYESSRAGAAVPDEVAVPALLKAGWNTLLVRVANESEDHALYLRLSDSAVDMARIRGTSKSTQ
jgi:WD40 repeat protein